MRKPIIVCLLLFLAAALMGGCQKRRLAQDALIESFCYETAGTAMGSETSFSIAREGERFAVTQSDGGGQNVRTAHVARETVMQATDILRRYRVHMWDGFAGANPLIQDGTAFDLQITFSDGTGVSARGMNSSPKGMTAAVREIKNLFDRFLREPE